MAQHDDDLGRELPGDGPSEAAPSPSAGAAWATQGSASSTEVVDAALRLVTALAARTLENADGVSVTLERHGRVMTVAASDDAVLTMDGHQYDTGEGPCLAAKAEARWFYIESLDKETRWPRFVPLALEQGIHSILSSPLMTEDRAQGALNIYSNVEQAFGQHEQELAALFADQASEILTAAGTPVTDEETRQRFADALTSRQTIARAEGMLMARDNLTARAAAAAMRAAAREAGLTLHAYADEVTGSSGEPPGASP
jgi:GAF domain-containing protein